MTHLERASFHIVFTPFVHILQVGESALAPPSLPVIRVVLRIELTKIYQNPEAYF